MTVPSTGRSSDKTLGQVLHEARVAGGEQRPRPWPPLPWANRDRELKMLDEAMAAAVAAAVRERDGARLAEVRETIATFRAHYGGSLHPQADALAHAVLQVVDKVPLGGGDKQERDDEKEPGS